MANLRTELQINYDIEIEDSGQRHVYCWVFLKPRPDEAVVKVQSCINTCTKENITEVIGSLAKDVAVEISRILTNRNPL